MLMADQNREKAKWGRYVVLASKIIKEKGHDITRCVA